MNYISSNFNGNDATLVACTDDIPLWSAPFGRVLLDKVIYSKSIAALDIGCGTGFPLLELAMRLGSSSCVYGIDTWPGALQRAVQKAKQFSIDNALVIEGSAEGVPVKDATIDLIVSNNGLNNVVSIDNVLSECSRVARPGCQFIMTMNLDTSMPEFYTLFKACFLAHDIESLTENIDRHIKYKRPAVAMISAICARNGFEEIDMTYDTFSMKFSDGTAMLNHYFIRLAFIESWIHCIPDSKRAAVMADVERRMNALAAAQGGVTLTIPFVCMEFCKK